MTIVTRYNEEMEELREGGEEIMSDIQVGAQRELKPVESELASFAQLVGELENYLQFPPVVEEDTVPVQDPSSKVAATAEKLRELNTRLRRCVTEVSNL